MWPAEVRAARLGGSSLIPRYASSGKAKAKKAAVRKRKAAHLEESEFELGVRCADPETVAAATVYCYWDCMHGTMIGLDPEIPKDDEWTFHTLNTLFISFVLWSSDSMWDGYTVTRPPLRVKEWDSQEEIYYDGQTPYVARVGENAPVIPRTHTSSSDGDETVRRIKQMIVHGLGQASQVRDLKKGSVEWMTRAFDLVGRTVDKELHVWHALEKKSDAHTLDNLSTRFVSTSPDKEYALMFLNEGGKDETICCLVHIIIERGARIIDLEDIVPTNTLYDEPTYQEYILPKGMQYSEVKDKDRDTEQNTTMRDEPFTYDVVHMRAGAGSRRARRR